MNSNATLIDNFYKAFQQKDFRTMQNSYADDATFTDPVFVNLNSDEVKSMWEMLLTASTDLVVSYNNVRESHDGISCDWDAVYTFTMTGRKVHNIIQAKFIVKDGKIISHRDHFDLYRWSTMAFGVKGVLLGWTPFMQNQIRAKARHRLAAFMKKKDR